MATVATEETSDRSVAIRSTEQRFEGSSDVRL